MPHDCSFPFTDCRGVLLGIGNIGPEYERTRHNVGFDTATLLAARSARPWQRYLSSEISVVPLQNGGNLLLCKPHTYVNRSGQAARELLDATGLSADRLLVAVDDLNLGIGALRIRSGGSAGGHNGLKSLIDSVGADFPRIRIGIGSPEPGVAIIDFVLGRFTDEQRNLAQPAIEAAADASLCFFDEGLEKCMNRYSRSAVSIVVSNQTVLPPPTSCGGQETVGGSHEA